MMMKSMTGLLFCSPLLLAAQIYSEPTEESEVISAVEASHEYSIKMQDWVEVTDHTTNKTGWVKLSEMKSDLSENSQWSYQWHSNSENPQQVMHYKPFEAEDVSKQIRKIHHQHKKIMNSFDSFWNDLEDEVADVAVDQA